MNRREGLGSFTLRYDGAGHHPVDPPHGVALAGIPKLLDE